MQVFILDSLSTYTAKDAKDAEAIIERVTPRLQHANCAVVLSAVKVLPATSDLRHKGCAMQLCVYVYQKPHHLADMSSL